MNTPKDALVISAFGAAALAFAGWPIVQSWRSRRWPLIKAIVLKSKTVGRTQATRFEIDYRYEVGGNSYTSDRLNFASSPRRVGLAEKYRKRFSEGSTIKVRYDPADPAQSTIETGIPSGYYFVAAVGLLFVLAGLSMFFILSSRAHV